MIVRRADARERAMYWCVQEEWRMQTAFIIGGGTSVKALDLTPLRGRAVIAVNSSYEVAPWAPYLFFGDLRWWKLHRKKLEGVFPGKIATTSEGAEGKLLKLKRRNPPPGMSTRNYEAVMRRTSVQAAMNMAYHLGSRRFVLLGCDNRDGPDGKTHHHSPHPWPRKDDTWEVKIVDLAHAAEDYRRLGVEVLNASPISTLPYWPIVKLEDTL
jgi:hypothetical protein